MERKKFFSAKNIAYFAVLLALVVVLQCCGGFFRIGATSLSFVLIPIVLGGILLGPLAGGVLGFVFGFVTLMYGFGADPFTTYLLNDSPVMTVLICIVKGTAAGIVPAYLYKLVAKKNVLAGVFVAAAAAPVVNTGLFIVGCFMISKTIAAVAGEGVSVAYFLFIGCAGFNFLIEFAINLVLSPAVQRVVLVVEKQINKKKSQQAENDESAFREVEGRVEVLEEEKALPENGTEALSEPDELPAIEGGNAPEAAEVLPKAQDKKE